MKIAFWNVGGMGPNVKKKLEVFVNWATEAKPAILFLSEVSADMRTELKIPNMMQMQWVSHPYENGQAGTKDLAIFVRQGVSGQAAEPTGFERAAAVGRERKQLGLLVSEAKRDSARMLVEFPKGVVVDMMGIHANASYSGGATAVACADATIAHARNTFPTMIGGDFNCDRGDLTAGKTKKITPLNYDEKDLLFTQWNKVDKERKYIPGAPEFDKTEFDAYCKNVHLSEDQVKGNYKRVEAHSLIDYALCSEGLNIKALKNCKDRDEWFDILNNFDHAPVLFDMEAGAV